MVKGSSGILILPAGESLRETVKNCIRCSRCITVCPMGLEPYLLEKLVMIEDYERTEKEKVMDCIECGSCHYICPANRSLLDYIRLGKNKVGQIMRTRTKN